MIEKLNGRAAKILAISAVAAAGVVFVAKKIFNADDARPARGDSELHVRGVDAGGGGHAHPQVQLRVAVANRNASHRRGRSVTWSHESAAVTHL